MSMKQVTRGYNFVADGWAGAYNPTLPPSSIPDAYTQHSKCTLSHFFNSSVTHRLSDQRTIGATDSRKKTITSD